MKRVRVLFDQVLQGIAGMLGLGRRLGRESRAAPRRMLQGCSVTATVVHLRGRFITEDEAKVDLLDRGFLLGDGVFATMRGYDGACFRPERHLASVVKGAAALGIPLPLEPPAISDIADEAARRTGAPDAYVRVTLTRGTFAVIARSLVVRPDSDYANGISTIAVGPRRIPPECMDPSFKTTSHAPQVIAWRELEARGVSEGIQLALDGTIAGGTRSNLFVVEGRVLRTPPTSTGCRPGVTREAVIEIARDVGLEVREERVELEAVGRADEAFFTSSTVECLPIRRGGRGPGFPTATALRTRLRELILAETRARRLRMV